MQPFPTAFWKKENLTLGEDSCFSPFEGSFSQNPTDSVYKMMAAKEPSTPTEAETSDGAIGLYADKLPQSHLHRKILLDEHGLEEPYSAWHMWWGDLNTYFAIDEYEKYNRFVNWEECILCKYTNYPEVGGFFGYLEEGSYGVKPVPTGAKRDATALSSNAYSIYEVNEDHGDYEKLAKHFWNRPTCHWPYIKADKDKNNKGKVFLTNEPVTSESENGEIEEKGFIGEGGGIGVSSSWVNREEVPGSHLGIRQYSEVMKHHWLDSWIRKDDLHRALGPVTYSPSEDCKTITVKCYFEKDAFQAISEYLHNPDVIDENDDDIRREFKYNDNFYGTDILKAIRLGYNGFQDVTSGLPQFFNRQRAKARFSFALGSKKYIRITIKGLGTDSANRLNLLVGEEAALVGGTIQDEKNAGVYPQSFTNKETAGLITYNNPNDPYGKSYYGTSYNSTAGDSQTCKIFIDDTEKIKCVAPQIGYFEYEKAPYQRQGYNPIYKNDWMGNYLKGPVRIFELESSTINEENEKVNNYKGTGGDNLDGSSKFTLDSNLDIEDGARGGTYADDYHYFYGLEYIDRSNFDNGKFYSMHNDMEQDGHIMINPYGNLWKNGDSTNFYDYDSNMVTPTYESPYSFIKDYELEKGDHTIDLLFDSVRCSMNGGAYYEIQIEIRD